MWGSTTHDNLTRPVCLPNSKPCSCPAAALPASRGFSVAESGARKSRMATVTFSTRLLQTPRNLTRLRGLLPRIPALKPVILRQTRKYGKMNESNRLRKVFTEGKGPSMGLWQMLPGANVSRILARCPVDWVMVDCEHGNISDGTMHDAVPAIAALGISPIVRVPDLQPWMIKRALDSGAHGVLVPLIRTVEEAKNVVMAAKFPPMGKRGFGSPLAMERFNPNPTFTEYLQQANDSLLTMAQIETKEALDSVDEIAALPGVDVIFCGPFDLGNNIGHPILDGVMTPELKTAIASILKASQKTGKKCGIFCTSGAQAKGYADEGWDMVSVATDATVLPYIMTSELSVARGESVPGRGGSY